MDKLGNLIHHRLPPEDDDGCIEYKWNLAKMDSYKRNKTSSQMKWRVFEAADNYSALYIIGVHDKGQVTGLKPADLLATIVNLQDCAARVKLFCCVRKINRLENGRQWAILQVFFKPDHNRGQSLDDSDIPNIPIHMIPDYLENI